MSEAFEQLLESVARGRDCDARAVARFDGAMLGRLLERAPTVGHSLATLRHANFSGVTFATGVVFSDQPVGPAVEQTVRRRVVFSGPATFDEAHFTGVAWFQGAEFEAGASFREVAFLDTADFSDATWTRDACFSHASFEGDVDFSGCEFRGDVAFDDAAFRGRARFAQERFDTRSAATFDARVDFHGAVFETLADLAGVRFRDRVTFDGTHFTQRVNLSGAEWADPDPLAGATFGEARWDVCEQAGCRGSCVPGHGSCLAHVTADVRRRALSRVESGLALDARGAVIDSALLEEVTTALRVSGTAGVGTGGAKFDWATFKDAALFENLTFRGETSFTGACFLSHAVFRRVRIEGFLGSGGIYVAGRLRLDHVSIESPIILAISAAEFEARGTTFLGGGALDFHGADLRIEDTAFPTPTSIAGSGDRAPFPPNVQLALSRASREPRCSVSSLDRSTVGKLLLRDIALTHCTFSGTRELDGLRLQGLTPFAEGLGRTRRKWWHTKRQTLIEEQRWRDFEDKTVSGTLGDDHIPSYFESRQERRETLRRHAANIAVTYRALRKGREDQKDEPGAADFYYGEMEMRRRSGPWYERLLLNTYWAGAGYGLRPLRTVLALLLTVTVFAALFLAGGFRDTAISAQLLAPVPSTAQGSLPRELRAYRVTQDAPERSFADAWFYSAGTATNVLNPPESELTNWGRALRILERVLGPVLLALIFLGVRSRVKR